MTWGFSVVEADTEGLRICCSVTKSSSFEGWVTGAMCSMVSGTESEHFGNGVKKLDELDTCPVSQRLGARDYLSCE
jgi:hypothetical protein